MAAEVILPRVDMDMTTGTISRWFIAEGESVEKGAPLFEIETDKAAMEIEAPASGILRATAATGVAVPVGTAVGWIVAAGETFAAPDADPADAAGRAAPSPPAATSPAATPAVATDSAASPGSATGTAAASPAAGTGLQASPAAGTGPAVSPAAATGPTASAAAATGSSSPAAATGLAASPAAATGSAAAPAAVTSSAPAAAAAPSSAASSTAAPSIRVAANAVARTPGAAPTATTSSLPEGVRATPLARRLARSCGVDLAAVAGSGPHGRIQAADVVAAASPSAAQADGTSPDIAAPRAVATSPTLATASGPAESPGAAAAPTAAPSPAVAARVAGVSPEAFPSPVAALPTQAPAPATALSAVAPGASAVGSAPLNSVWLRKGEGTPLVLLHGFGAELNGWRTLVQALGPGRPVLALDLPGHGASPLDGALSAEAIADRVAQAIAAAGVGALHLVGHSLGGLVAALVAERAALDVRSLLLISPAGLGPEINAAFLAGFVRAASEEALGAWMALLVADPAAMTPAIVRATFRMRTALADDQARVAAALFPDGTQITDARPALRRVAMPVRVVTGLADRIIPAHHASALPGHVAVHALAGVGHMPMLEARDLVARIVAEHIRSAA